MKAQTNYTLHKYISLSVFIYEIIEQLIRKHTLLKDHSLKLFFNNTQLNRQYRLDAF